MYGLDISRPIGSGHPDRRLLEPLGPAHVRLGSQPRSGEDGSRTVQRQGINTPERGLLLAWSVESELSMPKPGTDTMMFLR